jgi:hypothetical protein
MKQRCYWEHLEKHIWALDGNPMGTSWEFIGKKGKEQKIPLSSTCPLPHTSTRKKIGLFVSVEPSHWLHEISLSKIVHHHLSPGLIPISKSWGTFQSFTSPIHLSYSLNEVPPKFNFVGLAYQGKGIVFRFNIKYNSLS